MNHTPDVATEELPARWQTRFDFFAEYGPQNSTKAARAAYKALSFGQRVRIGANFAAFFFGPLYFFAKGMWRKGMTLLALAVGLAVLGTVLDVSDTVARAVGCGVAAIAQSTADYAYFLHVTAGSRSWNPFEGLGRR